LGIPTAVLIALLATAWLVDHFNGSAIREDGIGLNIGLPTVRKGDDVYFLAPPPGNRSHRPLKLSSLRPATSSPGLEFVEARVYQYADFIDAPPVCWATGGGKLSSPASVKSTPIAGTVVPAKSDLDAMIYLHFRVTTAQRPLEASGLKWTYRRGLREHSQVVETTYQVPTFGQS